MNPAQSKDALEALIVNRGFELATLDAIQAVDVMLWFYSIQRASGVVSLDKDGDMLLHEFGVFDWSDGHSFEFGLTRQFMEATAVDDDALSQLKLILLYEPSDNATDLGNGTFWCRHPDEVSEFKSVIESSKAMGFVRERKARRVTLGYEHV